MKSKISKKIIKNIHLRRTNSIAFESLQHIYKSYKNSIVIRSESLQIYRFYKINILLFYYFFVN